MLPYFMVIEAAVNIISIPPIMISGKVKNY
jgi:hypothetical protein